MGKAIPDVIKIAARSLRKSMTEPEKMLWSKLQDKKIGYKINR